MTDFDGTTLSKNFNYSSSPFTGTGVPFLLRGDTLNVNAKASLDWLGTTRAKVGFVVTPDNRTADLRNGRRGLWRQKRSLQRL